MGPRLTAKIAGSCDPSVPRAMPAPGAGIRHEMGG